MGHTCVWLHLKPLLLGLTSGLGTFTASRESTKDKVCERKKKGELEREMNTERETDRKKGKPPHPLHFQTLIYNFNISNFHSSAHFPNVIFQFMSNCVTIFLNTAYDKLGGKADMQFRLSVLQAQQQTH